MFETIVNAFKTKEIRVKIIYNASTCNESFADGIQQFMTSLVEQIAGNRQISISEMKMFNDSELGELVDDFMEDL